MSRAGPAVSVTGFELVDSGTGRQHVSMSGTWDPNAGGRLQVEARDVSIDALASAPGRPARYGGTLRATAVLTGTSAQPEISSDFSIAQGRVRRLAYQSLAGHVDYRDQNLNIDARLEQAVARRLRITVLP